LPPGAVAFSLLLLTGCATYWADRGNDASDIVDVGVTTSWKPGFSFYAGFLNIFTVGSSDVAGTLLGIGGRHVGAVPMRQNAGGVALYGREQLGYHDVDWSAPDSPEPWRVGVIGLEAGPAPSPGETVNCPGCCTWAGWA